MSYSKDQIIKAIELSGISKLQAAWICTFLDDAVKIIGEVQADTLKDFFQQFCILNNVSEEDIKSAKRDENLVKLRKRFAILAKEKFPNHSNREIGMNINRDRVTIIHYFNREKTRKEKRDNLERMKNGS